MRSMKLALVCAIAALAAACGPRQAASVKEGECKAFQRAAVEACGLTQADQDVLDDYVESGVVACHWSRPQARTPSCQDLRNEISTMRGELDRLRAQLKLPPPKPEPASKKKALWRRAIGM